MPVDALTQRDTAGRYEVKNSMDFSIEESQRVIHHIANSQARKNPQQCSALSALYASAILLPHVHIVSSSPERLQEEKNICVGPAVDRRSNLSAEISDVLSLKSATPFRIPMQKTSVAIPLLRGGVARRINSCVERAEQCGLASAETSAAEFLSFPIANAGASAAASIPSRWDEANQFYVVEEESAKGVFFQQIKNFLLENQSVNQIHADHLEFAWRYEAAGTALCVAPATSQLYFFRVKRISQATRDKNIADHIKQNCAFETEIFNSEDLSEGKMLILKAQRAENPFRMLYDNYPQEDVTTWIRYTADGLNFFADVVTLGMKPTISGLVAAYYRRSYFKEIGDEICATRQKYISWALLATGLDIDGIRFPSVKKKMAVKPLELSQVIPFNSNAAYFARNKDTAIQRELILTATHSGSAGKEGEKIWLKPRGQSEFNTFHPDGSIQTAPPKQVFFDDQRKFWRYVDEDTVSPLHLELSEGENLITLYGDQYPLHVSEDMRYHIMVTRPNGMTESLPVFRDPFSKTWHLTTLNFHPLFTPTQGNLIKRLKVMPNMESRYSATPNRYAHAYGDGRIFEVRNRQDDVATTAPLYQVVEMNGDLVPVRMAMTEKHGMHYDIYDIHHPLRKGHPIEWDGEHWRIERWTSPHISHALNERITSAMYAENIDETQLSVADSQGIKWAKNDRAYLKVRRKYVEIQKGKISYLCGSDGTKIAVQYKNNQFQPLASSILSKLKEDIAFDVRITELYDMLKARSKAGLLEGMNFFNIDKFAQTIFSPEIIRVEKVASEDIKKKRFIVFVEDQKYVLETTTAGKDIELLHGELARMAIEKYSKSMFGGNVKQALSLRRGRMARPVMARTRKEIDGVAAQRIQEGAQLIHDVIEKYKSEHEQEKKLIVGHADFLGTSAFENNVFASPSAVYQALTDYFIPLSSNNPNVIIAPGSIYMSKDIPEDLRGNGISYEQGGGVNKLDNAINFSTILAPVFYNGKLVTLARKGEYLHYRKGSRGQDETDQDLLQLKDLSYPIDAESSLFVSRQHRYDDFVPSELAEIGDIRSGTIFAGKSYLPEEKVLAGWFFCPCRDKNGDATVDVIFNNEFMIDNEKFLLIIEDEFEKHHDFMPTVRRQALSSEDNLDDANRYDWILHSTAGRGLDAKMRSVGSHYIHADIGNENECASEGILRFLIGTTWEEKQLAIFDCTADL